MCHYNHFFKSPTVAEMAAPLTAHQEKKLDEKGLTALLDELELLSDEEAKRLVSEAPHKNFNE